MRAVRTVFSNPVYQHAFKTDDAYATHHHGDIISLSNLSNFQYAKLGLESAAKRHKENRRKRARRRSNVSAQL